MNKKKIFAILLSVAIIFGMFANIPLSAAAPDERIDVLLSGDYWGLTPFDEPNIYKVDEQGKYGLFSADTGWITECKWDEIELFTDNLYWAANDNGCTIVDKSGNELITAPWLYEASGFIMIFDVLKGFADMHGNVILEPTFEHIESFSEGFARVYLNEKVGFINTAGRTVVDLIWSDALNFSDSLAAVMNENGLWGFVNKEGTLVIDCKYENVSSFSSGYACVVENGKPYIIDKTGRKVTSNGAELVVEAVYDCDGAVENISFSGSVRDVACVKFEGQDNYCYVDKNFNVLTESIFKFPVIFTDEDYAIAITVNNEGKDKYSLLSIDRTNGVEIKTLLSEKNYITEEKSYKKDLTLLESDGRLYNLKGVDLFGIEYDMHSYNYDDSNIINARYNNQYICVDFDGNVISGLSDYKYSLIKANLYLGTTDDGKIKICDATGKQLSATDKYAKAVVQNEYIFVQDKTGNWGVINTDCSVLIEPQFDELLFIDEGMLKYKNNGKYGFVNMETGEIIKAKFSRAADFQEGLCWVSEKTLVGAIDKNGNYVINPVYWGNNDCTSFTPNRFSCGVTAIRKDKNGYYGVLNTKGQKVLDFKYWYIGDFNESGIAVFQYDLGDTFTCGLMRVVSNDALDVPTKITPHQDEILTYVGCYATVSESITPDTSADLGVTYTVNDETVATVDSVGHIYGVSEGVTYVTIRSNANPEITATVTVRIEDRELHSVGDIIPLYAWEEQTWLSDYVISKLSEEGIEKTVETLTYGDLLGISEIIIEDFEDTNPDVVYHIPSIIGEFANLSTLRFDCRIFAPILSTLPDSAKFLSNLYFFNTYNIYSEQIDESIIRNNSAGIPDKNLYHAICGYSYYCCVYTHSYVSSLKARNIHDLTGLSLLNNFSYELDLSNNYITDISELGNINIYNANIDLSYNQLDLSDEKTLAVISKLQNNGCYVNTDHQNETTLLFGYNDEYYQNVYTPTEFKISLDYTTTSEYSFFVHPFGSVDDFSITTENNNIAKPIIEKRDDGNYYLICKATGLGKTVLYVKNNATGEILYEIPVIVNDPKFFVEDIVVSYYIDNWEPSYARLNCSNNYSYLQFRLKGEKEWQTGNQIYKNGTYEVRYCSYNGKFSNIETLVIDGIRQLLTYTQMPDQKLRNCFNSGNVYEGYQVDYFYASFYEISDLTGLSLLDFSNCHSWIYLNNNNISDISELAKLGLKNTTIDLSSNKIDFTSTKNANALRELYKNGCTVTMEDQFVEEFFVETSNNTFSTQLGINWSSSIRVSPVSEIDNIALVLEETDVITNFSYYVNENYIYYSYTTSAYGTAKVNVLYKGEFLKSFTITLLPYQGQQDILEANVRISSYYEEQGFGVSFEYGGNYFEYRKLGDSEWTRSYSSWFNIKTAGTYEFRYADYSGNISKIAVLELKTCETEHFKLYFNNGEWCICSVKDTAAGKDIVVPETVDGYPVTLFSNNNGVMYNSIYFPKTIKTIEHYNLYANNVIVSEVSPYFKVIENFIVEKATNSTVWYPTPANGILTVPNGIKVFNAMSLFTVKALNLPESVQKVYNLSNFGNLETITVDSNNSRYFVEDGLLYEKYTGTLVICPAGKTGSLKLPDNVLFIANGAFTNSQLTELTLPSSLIAGDYCFAMSSRSKKINVSYGIISLGANAFCYNYSLYDIFIPSSVTSVGNNIVSSHTTVACVPNSAMHQAAMNYGYNYVLVYPGDFNYDGNISANDLVEYKKFLLLNGDFSTVEPTVYDLNSDNKADVIDFIKFQKDFADENSSSEPNTVSTNIEVEPAYLEEKNTIC